MITPKTVKSVKIFLLEIIRLYGTPYKHRLRHCDEKKRIGHARLLAEVPSTSVEYCEVYKIPKKAGSSRVPWSPGPLFIPTGTIQMKIDCTCFYAHNFIRLIM